MIEPTKRIAPYLPFKTFLGSLDALSHGVPPKLDRTLWRSQAGLTQGLIMNAYRFFGLVDETEGDASSQELVTMAKHPEQRPEILRGLIEIQYEEILEKTDLTKATMKMLEEEFERQFSVSGATKQKAIAFFLKAAKFSDMPLSPYLQAQLRNAGPRKRRGLKQRVERGDQQSLDSEFGTENQSEDGQASAVSSHKVVLASGGTLTVALTANPFKLPQEDRDFVFSIIDRLQEYERSHESVQRAAEDVKAER